MINNLTNEHSDTIETIDGVDYRVITWRSSGSFDVSENVDVEYLVVGGGGSGGGPTSTNRSGGGGGAGGLLTNLGGTPLTLSGSTTINVGAGGAAPGAALGNDGGASEIDAGVTTVRAEGGGGGGRAARTDSEGPGRAGGSGGGGGGSTTSTTPVAGGAGTAGQGNNGSDGLRISNVSLGGGGGGAGATAGNAGASSNRGGAGGAGLANAITGTSVTYAGGGGGGSAAGGVIASGGAGGGGTSGTAGTNALGGGGGGATNSTTGTTIAAGKGGDGVVIIRYDLAQENIGSGDDLGSGDDIGSGDDLSNCVFFRPKVLVFNSSFGQYWVDGYVYGTVNDGNYIFDVDDYDLWIFSNTGLHRLTSDDINSMSLTFAGNQLNFSLDLSYQDLGNLVNLTNVTPVAETEYDFEGNVAFSVFYDSKIRSCEEPLPEFPCYYWNFVDNNFIKIENNFNNFEYTLNGFVKNTYVEDIKFLGVSFVLVDFDLNSASFVASLPSDPEKYYPVTIQQINISEPSTVSPVTFELEGFFETFEPIDEFGSTFVSVNVSFTVPNNFPNFSDVIETRLDDNTLISTITVESQFANCDLGEPVLPDVEQEPEIPGEDYYEPVVPEPDDLPESSIFGFITLLSSVFFVQETVIQGFVGVDSFVTEPSRLPILLPGETEPPVIENPNWEDQTELEEFPEESFDDTAIKKEVEGLSPSQPLPVTPKPVQKLIADPGSRVAPRRKTVMCDMDGNVLVRGFLSSVTQSSVTWERSRPTEWSISCNVNSLDALKLMRDLEDPAYEGLTGIGEAFKEVQLWRNNKLLTWGPITNFTVNGDTLTVSGSDSAWYLSRRSVGPAIDINLLPNPKLEQGSKDWIAINFRGWRFPEQPNTPELNVTRVRVGGNATPEIAGTANWGWRIEDKIPLYIDNKSMNDGVWDLQFEITWRKVAASVFSPLGDVDPYADPNPENVPSEWISEAARAAEEGFSIGAQQIEESGPDAYQWALTAIEDIKKRPYDPEFPWQEFRLAGLYAGIIAFNAGESVLSLEFARRLVIYAQATLGFRPYIAASKNLLQFNVFKDFIPEFIGTYTSQDQIWFDQDYNFGRSQSYANCKNRKEFLVENFLRGSISLREAGLRLAGIRIGFQEQPLTHVSVPLLFNQSDINRAVILSLEYLTRRIRPTFANAYTLGAFKRQPIDTNITFSCFARVQEFISPNEEGSCIGIGLFPKNARGLQDIIEVNWASLREGFPINQVQRVTVSMTLPANKDTFAVFMVRGPKGVTLFWDFDLQWNGGLINVNTDKNVIIRRLVDHLSGNPNAPWAPSRQHPLWPLLGWPTYFKSDVKLGTSFKEVRGIKVDRTYPFGTGAPGLNLITQLCEDDNSTGWNVVNSPNKRWLGIQTKRSVRRNLPIVHTPYGGNVIGGFGWQWMGEQAANVVVVQSSQGSSKQVMKFDREAFKVTIEETTKASEDNVDSELDGLASRGLFYKTKPVSIGFRIHANPYFTSRNLQVGDLVPVNLKHGNVNIFGIFRIHRMTLTDDDFLDITATPHKVETDGNIQEIPMLDNGDI